MSLQFTSEQFRQLQSQRVPVFVEDPASQAKYVILSQEEYRRILDEELRKELQVAFDEADAGEEEDWSLDAFLAKARSETGPQS